MYDLLATTMKRGLGREAPVVIATGDCPTNTVAERDHVDWIRSLPFFGVHLACLGACWTGISWNAAFLCAGLYVIRMFGITAGYHRYFAHRSYRTSRSFQFLLAWIACSAVQKGPLWWAGHHRHHHKHSDEESDVHSPLQRGFWWSHVGWVLSTRYLETDVAAIKDFAKYPELRWMNRFQVVPGVLLAIGCFLAMGWQGLVWGFFVSTVLLYHATFGINSLCHLFGTVRYTTADGSRNSLLLALITLGEGWHNNHHHFASSTRQGFFWWEIDFSFYTLKVLSWVGLVWALRTPPRAMLSPTAFEGRRASR
jgi:stearoyl-CoA desaturase (delta-9 desaturase)